MKALIAYVLAALLLAVACNIHPDTSSTPVDRLMTIICFILSVICAWVGISNTEQ